MAHFVQLWRSDRQVGELGPFRTQQIAAAQARAMAPCAGRGTVVMVVNGKTRRRNGKKPKRSQAAMKKLGRRIKASATASYLPKTVRKPVLAFAFALLDPKVALVDKYLAVGGAAPLAAADGPLPLGDLAAAGLTITKMTRLAKDRHRKQADRALAKA